MHVDNLIKMANQIGDYYASMADRGEALEGIATHIKKFWEPRMRRELLAHIDAGHVDTIRAIVVEALAQHRAQVAV